MGVLCYYLTYSEHYLEAMIRYAQVVLPDVIVADHDIRIYMETARENFKELSTKEPTGPSLSSDDDANDYFELSFLWKSFTSILLGMFFLSLISHFAQYYQMTLDIEDSNILRRRLPAKIRMEISSPSGRLRLPVPTPLKNKATASKAAAATSAVKKNLETAAATSSSSLSVTPQYRPANSPSTVLFDPFPPGSNVRLKPALKTTSKLPRIDDAATMVDSPNTSPGPISSSSANQLRALKD
jgi:hypothetical protein